MGWDGHPGPMMGGPYGGPPAPPAFGGWGGPGDRAAMQAGMSMGWPGEYGDPRSCGGGYGGDSGGRGPKRGQVEQYHGVLVMEMVNDLAGCIIGRGGSVISSIRRSCGGRLEVREGNRPGGGERVVIIDGEEDEVMRLITEVFDLLANPPSRTWGESSDDRAIDVTVVMSSAEMGAIMGRSGKNITRIREQAGARIRVDSGFQEAERTATVTGTCEQVKQALMAVARTLFDEGKVGQPPPRFDRPLPPPPPPVPM
uniref:K Homology domain-containing protein n=1 Tax=Alexandrium monilatum TaxID=311494 RepID=A0A7S4VVT6_9DINO|eukprot:CAMPEP_0175669354 /NCGR_PEP_ID=MMETSP0097-20121207/19094_1 /TAXON_ID=311494 /ORGANISM="Alexandrium monilatum, Strain CCMP3105" /LENGTH=254 /DNA_ID=CAMNT_0016975881 /DNA_START=1 /DNA_END=765 /DNA_ORIENTATION=+